MAKVENAVAHFGNFLRDAFERREGVTTFAYRNGWGAKTIYNWVQFPTPEQATISPRNRHKLAKVLGHADWQGLVDAYRATPPKAYTSETVDHLDSSLLGWGLPDDIWRRLRKVADRWKMTQADVAVELLRRALADPTQIALPISAGERKVEFAEGAGDVKTRPRGGGKTPSDRSSRKSPHTTSPSGGAGN